MELGFLKPLFDRPGPWASVYIDTTWASEDTAHQWLLRQRAVAAQLIDEGADAYTVKAVMDTLSEEPISGTPPGRALFAAGAEVVLDLPLAVAPYIGEAGWSTLPHTAPLAGLHDDQPPCLVAFIDHLGADLELRDALRQEPAGQAKGKRWRGHRTVPDDRHEWHFRNKTENTWKQNAEIIADEIARTWPDCGAGLLVLAGDARERKAVYERLPHQLRAVSAETEHGGRSSGRANGRLDQEVARIRQEHARTRLQSALDHFRAGRGRGGEHRPGSSEAGPGEAAEGVPAVLDAARAHQVATLLMAQIAPDGGRDVWIGPGADQVAVQRGEVQAMGVAKPQRARADDALMRSAAAGDAEVMLVPDGMPGPAGGFGAVLRWAA
ncbi:baeRF2 domain-containing protein [Streptomyces sp. 8N706]|uniref:baeRF2 domain-containing protein n=1 Tax=Streptomyces sp. 8N706 TaxID=3457416 RepID=UPI003FD093C9